MFLLGWNASVEGRRTTWDTEDGFDPELLEAGEEVGSDFD